MQEQEERKELITQSAILEMGFTKTMITKLLPKPIEKSNPYYKCASPMKLWEKELVLKVMDTNEFKEELDKANKRRKASTKAVESKKNKLKEQVEELKLNLYIRKLSDKKLIHKTIMDKNYWYSLHNDFEFVDEKTVDKATLDRWIVNYIRHNLIDYDDDLMMIKGKVVIGEAYVDYKKYVLKEIAKIYPKYKDECLRQINVLTSKGEMIYET